MMTETKIFSKQLYDYYLCYDGEYYFIKRIDGVGNIETSTPFFNAVFLIESLSEGNLEFTE